MVDDKSKLTLQSSHNIASKYRQKLKNSSHLGGLCQNKGNVKESTVSVNTKMTVIAKLRSVRMEQREPITKGYNVKQIKHQ